jgi:hypothetical protein
MSNLLSLISGPLDKSYCRYFLLLTIFFFVIFVIAVIIHIFLFIKNRNHISFINIFGGLYMIFTIFIAYFVNRLMYNICYKSYETS